MKLEDSIWNTPFCKRYWMLRQNQMSFLKAILMREIHNHLNVFIYLSIQFLCLTGMSANTQLILANLINIESGLSKYRFSSNLSTQRFSNFLFNWIVFLDQNLFLAVSDSIHDFFEFRTTRSTSILSNNDRNFAWKFLEWQPFSNWIHIFILCPFSLSKSNVHSNWWSWNCQINFENKIEAFLNNYFYLFFLRINSSIRRICTLHMNFYI